MTSTAIESIDSSLCLPNGYVVPNRLVKVAMEEGIGYAGGLPGSRHRRLYRKWGEGGWGIIITGNAQVDPKHPATTHDRNIPDSSPRTISAYSALVTSALSHLPPDSEPPLLLMQISHGGLQSSSTINLTRWPWTPAIAPCETRPDTGSSIFGWIVGRIVWPMRSRRIIDLNEWLGIKDNFVRAAKVAKEAGFGGVQVHSAHGYLLAEYLSPLTNPEVKPLPGVHWKIPIRLHLLYLILKGIREETDKSFTISVKINSSDFVQGGIDEEQSVVFIKEIVSWGFVDILEISGGNYSSPAFAQFETITSSSRQTLFSHFTSTLIPQLPSPPEGPAILLTGGLHSRGIIADCLKSKSCDLAGIGRPACIHPTLPRDILLNPEISDRDTVVGGYTIPGGKTMKWLLGGGRSSSSQVSNTLRSKQDNPHVSTYLDTESNGSNDESTPLLKKGKEDKDNGNGIPLIGAGISTYWHEWQLSRIGRGAEPSLKMDWFFGGVIWEGVVWGVLGAFLGLFEKRF